MVTRHKLTEDEYQALTQATDKAHPLLAELFSGFIHDAGQAGMDHAVIGAALAQYMLVNLARTLAICSGLTAAELDDEGLKILAARVQRKLVQDISEYVRVRTPDDQIEDYVSPQTQKQNDAAERADYEYDRDKEERIDNSRN